MLELNSFVKSSFSLTNCVAARLLPGDVVEVAHTQDLTGPSVRYTAQEWAAFLDGVKAGEFDLPTT